MPLEYEFDKDDYDEYDGEHDDADTGRDIGHGQGIAAGKILGRKSQSIVPMDGHERLELADHR